MTAEVLAPPDNSEPSSDGRFSDGLFARLMAAAALTVIAVLVATAVFLLIRAWPALSHYGPLSFFHARWAPSESTATSAGLNPYGILQFIYGTVVTSLVAMVIVSEGADAADDWIAERITSRDICVTGDIPLASRCLKKDARALAANGKLWTKDNIGNALAGREVGRHLRETGVNTGGPPPFSKADRSRFLSALDAVVQAALRS